MTEEKEVLERSEVIHEHELVVEDLEQSLARDLVRAVDRALEARDVVVAESCSSKFAKCDDDCQSGNAESRRRNEGNGLLPADSSLERVAIQSASRQL